jgi:mono/diheme cytochrome c family protein/glucose/arabinose dehydrogenase
MHAWPQALIVASLCSFSLAAWSESDAAGRDAAEQEQVEPEDLNPGLLATYRWLVDESATLVRVDAKPAFYLGQSSPHPRIPPGPFEVEWTGRLLLWETGPISFDAYVCGEASVEVDGVTVLAGRGEDERAVVAGDRPLDRPPGLYRLKVRYRALGDRPARLQIWWQGPGFSREPLPAWRLKHDPAELPAAARDEQLIACGRDAVGRFGCARCHRSAFPASTDAPPGPSLADAGRRIGRAWLLKWLDDPARVHDGARMPALFSPDRTGFVERWIIAEFLLKPLAAAADAATDKDVRPRLVNPPGDHRLGRRQFVAIGCAACHYLPDSDQADQPDPQRSPLSGLNDRLPAAALVTFLSDPHARYPDGRMPRLPLEPEAQRNIAAYLLLWSKPAVADDPAEKPPTRDEIDQVARRLGTQGVEKTAEALVGEKRCAACHSGLATGPQADPFPDVAEVPLAPASRSGGCLSGRTLPRFAIEPETQRAIAAYRTVAARERWPSPFHERQRLVARLGCKRCHQRDGDRPPPIEEVGSTLGGAWLEQIPYQRTPRLNYAHQKYTPVYLLAAVREGVSGVRLGRYSYRMPGFGGNTEAIVQALAEADGDLVGEPEPAAPHQSDPTIGPLAGPMLVGFQGYSCVSCHFWNGQTLSDPDPGAVGPDLTRTTARIRRAWFDRFLENPDRFHPRTPMPMAFPKGQPAPLRTVLDGDPAKQRDALWSYLALGKDAPSPKPAPPLPVTAPAADEPPVVAQIPIRLPDGSVVESISILTSDHDLVIYDIQAGAVNSVFTGAQILRDAHGRLRKFIASGTPVGHGSVAGPALRLLGSGEPESPSLLDFRSYDRLGDGVRIRYAAQFPAAAVEVVETLRVTSERAVRRLLRDFALTGIPPDRALELRSRAADSLAVDLAADAGTAKVDRAGDIVSAVITPDGRHGASVTIRYELPAAQSPPAFARTALADPGKSEGTLERPGYRAIAYPRPKAASGEDLIMPVAVAAHPRDGRLFVASMKLGEIFVLHDPTDDGRSARFENYARSLFQDAYSMLAQHDALFVLHRRNLTKVTDPDGDGVADRFERVAALPHGVADTYDYAYGLVRDRSGSFVISYAPYANQHLPGSGGALRLDNGKTFPGGTSPRARNGSGGALRPEPAKASDTEIAFGFRNPIGWCVGPNGEIFFTDNQGEWVATNKLCHVVEGRFYGFPNPMQKQHATRPRGKAAIWVPYGWARSINGVTYDNTGGKFGPFAGQIFMAELMFGGAIIRANLEKVNGAFQGACLPFWGKGLLGPVTLAFDARGRLFVGGITEPGWMAQPDRGALYRIDFTGAIPFEMQSIHARPRGFRIVFTAPVSPDSACDPAAYHIEHYRYEYTGAYGSPELDRTSVAVEGVTLSDDARSVELTLTSPLASDRVYMINARGVRSEQGDPLVQPTGAYTLNEIPAD